MYVSVLYQYCISAYQRLSDWAYQHLYQRISECISVCITMHGSYISAVYQRISEHISVNCDVRISAISDRMRHSQCIRLYHAISTWIRTGHPEGVHISTYQSISEHRHRHVRIIGYHTHISTISDSRVYRECIVWVCVVVLYRGCVSKCIVVYLLVWEIYCDTYVILTWYMRWYRTWKISKYLGIEAFVSTYIRAPHLEWYKTVISIDIRMIHIDTYAIHTDIKSTGKEDSEYRKRSRSPFYGSVICQPRLLW